MIAKELMSSKVVRNQEEQSFSSIEGRLTFPAFQKYSDILAAQLLPKTAKDFRSKLRISIEDVQLICDKTGA